MFTQATIIKDSISAEGTRLTTMELVYPRFVHGEFMTHRVFSRNASSSRAIPVLRMLKNIITKTAKPVYWGKNKPGMQSTEELSFVPRVIAKGLWFSAATAACIHSGLLHMIGFHKQYANRVTEPYQYITVVVTATEWDNFFELRLDSDAQPEINNLAKKMREALDNSKPTLLNRGDWHLPYVTHEELKSGQPMHVLCKVSSARCARTSYLTHDNKNPVIEKDLELFDRLAGSRPLHASPLEHVATPSTKDNTNFVNWKQFRKVIEQTV